MLRKVIGVWANLSNGIETDWNRKGIERNGIDTPFFLYALKWDAAKSWNSDGLISDALPGDNGKKRGCNGFTRFPLDGVYNCVCTFSAQKMKKYLAISIRNQDKTSQPQDCQFSRVNSFGVTIEVFWFENNRLGKYIAQDIRLLIKKNWLIITIY